MIRVSLRCASLFVFAALLAASLRAQSVQVSQQNRTIAISTSDDASALADTAQIQVGFEIYGKDQAELYAEASKTSNTIIDALRAAGVPKPAIESLGQSLRPLSGNGDDEKARFAQGLRFTFTQNWRVTSSAEQAARILQLAISAGANNSGDIAWTLKDDQSLQTEAATKALTHARAIASSMAEGLGAKLGALIYAGNQAPAGDLAPRPMFRLGTALPAGTATAELSNAPLALAPQRITRSATVYAIFAIQ